MSYQTYLGCPDLLNDAAVNGMRLHADNAMLVGACSSPRLCTDCVHDRSWPQMSMHPLVIFCMCLHNMCVVQMLAYNWTSTRANFTEMVKHKLPIFYKGICYDADGKLDQEKATRLMVQCSHILTTGTPVLVSVKLCTTSSVALGCKPGEQQRDGCLVNH